MNEDERDAHRVFKGKILHTFTKQGPYEQFNFVQVRDINARWIVKMGVKNPVFLGEIIYNATPQ